MNRAARTAAAELSAVARDLLQREHSSVPAQVGRGHLRDEHPGLIDSGSVEVLTGRTASRPLHEVHAYEPRWGLPSSADRAETVRILTAEAPHGGSAPQSLGAVS